MVACTARGGIFWSYIKWRGGNRNTAVYNLFISDLDGDGRVEVVAGKDDEIFIFSNKGRLLDKMIVSGNLSCWKNPNAKMDIADVNNDGKQKIMAVTSIFTSSSDWLLMEKTERSMHSQNKGLQPLVLGE